MPRRKPASARLNRETRDIGLVRAATVGVPEPPRMPDGSPLPESVREAWVRFWRSDVSGLVVDADRPALDRLFVNYALHAAMMAAWAAQPFTLGSTGQVVIHPAAKEAAALEARIAAAEDRFGVTPSARLKLGIVLGAAAKSLEELNRAFRSQPDDEDEEDPRVGLRVVGATVAEVAGWSRGAVDAVDVDPRRG